MIRQLLGAALFALAGAAGQAQVGTVAVAEGKLDGVSADGVTAFKGVPFAAAPVGTLRWASPVPAPHWAGVRQADRFAPSCMQDPAFSARMGMPPAISEDCLYLNVWTPAKTAAERLPVMVWIYGGGFALGSTAWPIYDGTRFAKQGVVLVSVAYRLGALGFLATSELSREGGGGSGTYGLQDQVAALRWVKANIARFGGDPARVTIFGESAGGMSTSILAASPPARGLFQRVISESGGSFSPPQTVEGARGETVMPLDRAEAQGARFLAAIGAKDIAAARALPAATVQAGPDASRMGGFWPVLDGKVIVGDQYVLYGAGRFNDTPALIGTNSDEGALFAQPGMTTARFEEEVRHGFGAHAGAILAAYPHATDADAAQASKDIFRDSTFGWSTWAWARLQAEHGATKPFVYYFDHRTPTSPHGASHAAEMAFVFGNFGVPGGENPTLDERTLSDRMQRYWVNFARSGDPNGPGLPQWPRFDPAEQQVLMLDGGAAAVRLPNLPQLKAMDNYFAWRRTPAGAH